VLPENGKKVSRLERGFVAKRGGERGISNNTKLRLKDIDETTGTPNKKRIALGGSKTPRGEPESH